jgi:hypothetical protein
VELRNPLHLLNRNRAYIIAHFTGHNKHPKRAQNIACCSREPLYVLLSSVIRFSDNRFEKKAMHSF